MVIPRRAVGHQRTQRIERRLKAVFKLEIHVFLNHVERYMARPFNHHLASVFPGNLRQLAQRLQLGQLRFVIRIGNTARPQPVAQ